MKNIKKYILISFVFIAMVFTSTNYAYAKSNDISSFNERLVAIASMMEIAKNYPSYASFLEPIILEYIQNLFSDINSFTSGDSYNDDDSKDDSDNEDDDKDKHGEDEDDDSNDDEHGDDDSDNNDWVFSVGAITDLKAEPYENIDNKWKVEIEFADDEDYTFYVYDIYSDDELVSNIADKIEDEFDFGISDSEVDDILEIED